MIGEEDEVLVLAAGDFFEAVAEFEFFCGEEFEAEAAGFGEGVAADEEERASGPVFPAGEAVPLADEEFGAWEWLVHDEGAAAEEDIRSGDGGGEFLHERCGGGGVGVEEEEP